MKDMIKEVRMNTITTIVLSILVIGIIIFFMPFLFIIGVSLVFNILLPYSIKLIIGFWILSGILAFVTHSYKGDLL